MRCLRLVPAASLALLAAATSNVVADTAIPEAARTEANSIWATRCTPCHGAAGKGDGMAAAALNPKPRDLSLAAWQATAKDEQIEKVILEGGPAVGLSPLMPPNPDLKTKPEVVDALRELIRSYKAK